MMNLSLNRMSSLIMLEKANLDQFWIAFFLLNSGIEKDSNPNGHESLAAHQSMLIELILFIQGQFTHFQIVDSERRCVLKEWLCPPGRRGNRWIQSPDQSRPIRQRQWTIFLQSSWPGNRGPNSKHSCNNYGCWWVVLNFKIRNRNYPNFYFLALRNFHFFGTAGHPEWQYNTH